MSTFKFLDLIASFAKKKSSVCQGNMTKDGLVNITHIKNTAIFFWFYAVSELLMWC